MMSNNLSVIIKEMITTLNDGEWHDIYSLHDQFRLSPAEVLSGIQFLESLNLIVRKDDMLKLLIQNINDTTLKKLALLYRHTFSIKKLDQQNLLYFSSKKKININDFYLPIIRLLDRSLLTENNAILYKKEQDIIENL